eukprot:scaffold21329_cov62-Phaeocystis_antarctica.AAC.5
MSRALSASGLLHASTTNLIGAPRSSKLTACVALRCDTRELNCNAVESVPMPLGTATAASSASIWVPSKDRARLAHHNPQ